MNGGAVSVCVWTAVEFVIESYDLILWEFSFYIFLNNEYHTLPEASEKMLEFWYIRFHKGNI